MQMETIGPYGEAAFAPAEPASATRGNRFPPEKTMSTERPKEISHQISSFLMGEKSANLATSTLSSYIAPV
jgi:hypothetical protein